MSERPANAGAAEASRAATGAAGNDAAKAGRRSGQRRANLEREIILAVVVLYFAIFGVMVAVHYLQPAGQPSVTSSPLRK